MVRRREAPQVSRAESCPTIQPEGAPDYTGDPDRLLVDRIRLGLRLVLAGIAFVFVGELIIGTGDQRRISMIQAANFAAVAVALSLLREPSRRAFNFAVGWVAYVITVVAVGAVGIAAGDATTPVVLFVGLAVVTATLLPWSPWWQLLSVALLIGTAIWTVATVVESPHLFWLQNVGSVAPTMCSTIFLCHALRRQRATVERAEAERRSREESLREANQRLGQEIQEHRRTEDTLRFAMRELDHRVKNTLAMVQSVADQTLRSARSLDDFSDAFCGRIQALARIHTALAGRRWEGLTLAELIELVVGPYRHHADSIAVECDATFVASELVRVLGMTLHELATNAAKYGALSTKEGRVAISSRVEADAAARLRISWSERGGPRVQTPARRGFGTKLIAEALPYEVDGRVTLQFPDQGVSCIIEIPVPST